MGLPLSSVSSSANSSMFFSSRSARRQSSLPRSLADIFCQGPPRSSKALRASLTARSTSAAPASATWVITSPVAGLMVSKVFAVTTHSPPIRSLPGSTRVLLAASIFIHHKTLLTTEVTEDKLKLRVISDPASKLHCQVTANNHTADHPSVVLSLSIFPLCSPCP